MQNIKTKKKQKNKLKFKLNKRLITIILFVSLGLAFLVSAIIDTHKTYPVRVIDNIFLGAILNLIFMLFFRMQTRLEREKNKRVESLTSQRGRKLNRYESFSLFAKHFLWSSIILFVLSGLATVIYSLI